MNSHCYVCADLLKIAPSGSNKIIKLYLTPCADVFHKICLEEFLKTSSQCPQCSRPIDTSKLLPMYVDLPSDLVKETIGVLNKLRSENLELLEEKMHDKKTIADLQVAVKKMELDTFILNTETNLQKEIAQLKGKKETNATHFDE